MAPLATLLNRVATFTFTHSSDHHPLHARAAPPSTKTQPVNPNYKPGGWSFDPHNINNKGFFILFALIGVAFVLASIWFFFWAKNGGFHFREGDWDDYKSTVLRRKGPNGTTLSGATKTTRLGGGSVVAGEAESSLGGYDEKVWQRGVTKGARRSKADTRPAAGGQDRKRGKKNGEDDDVRAYRHEKPARVGGLNRDSDGVSGRDFAAAATGPASTAGYSDYSANPSETSAFIPINTPRRPKAATPGTAANGYKRYAAEPKTPSPSKTHKKNAFYATPASNTSTDSHRPLRPHAAQPGSAGSTPTRSRNSSPRKSGMPGGYTEPLDFDSRYNGSDAGLSEDSRGTKAYFHPIPGLSGEAGRKSTGAGNGGFRRGRGRRDSLSDGEEDIARY